MLAQSSMISLVFKNISISTLSVLFGYKVALTSPGITGDRKKKRCKDRNIFFMTLCPRDKHRFKNIYIFYRNEGKNIKLGNNFEEIAQNTA